MIIPDEEGVRGAMKKHIGDRLRLMNRKIVIISVGEKQIISNLYKISCIPKTKTVQLVEYAKLVKMKR